MKELSFYTNNMQNISLIVIHVNRIFIMIHFCPLE